MNWQERYNSEIGLWASDGPGHTIQTKNLDTVHAGPNAASRLLAAAQVDALNEMNVVDVLSALKNMQWTGDDGKRGCMKWYWEEDQPYDTNAAFFTGLSLIVIHKCYHDRLDSDSQKILHDILTELMVWFDHAIEHATIHYPNKYLGDLVCGWLLLEILDRVETDTHITEHMHRAANYWLDEGWGWGEHLSDIYTGVCLNELSVLLLLADQLPQDLHKRYTDLMANLLSIEDAYDGGPRVPALRSYAFQEPRSHTNYRDRVKPWDETPTNYGNSPDLGNLLYGLGWHEKMPPRTTQQQNPITPCFDGTIAKAHITPDTRIGSVSRFPVMPSAEHPTWGLSWQCFPIALSRGGTDWGYLQWEIEENDTPRAHPANGGPMAHIPKSLTQATTAPLTGQTYAIQRNGNLLVLRLMRVIPTAWDALTDRFRIIGQTGTHTTVQNNNWSTLKLTYPERTVCVHHLTLADDEPPQITENPFNGIDWSYNYLSNSDKTVRLAAALWAFSLEDNFETEPDLKVVTHGAPKARTAEESVRELIWPWPDTTWHVRIDPLATEPLIEIQ